MATTTEVTRADVEILLDRARRAKKDPIAYVAKHYILTGEQASELLRKLGVNGGRR